jgi:hypothetical protein
MSRSHGTTTVRKDVICAIGGEKIPAGTVCYYTLRNNHSRRHACLAHHEEYAESRPRLVIEVKAPRRSMRFA